MMTLYRMGADGGLDRMAEGADPAAALWLDLLHPSAEEVAAVEALHVRVPTPAEMEGIELSNRLYRADGAEHITIVLPGADAAGQPVAGPVRCILTPARLITVRHHTPGAFAPRPADRAGGRLSAACAGPAGVFLGLAEDSVARLADLLEGAGQALEALARDVYSHADARLRDSTPMRHALRRIGTEGAVLGRVRLALVTLERALGFFAQTRAGGDTAADGLTESLQRDIQALAQHADFLSQRLEMATDATLGLIGVAQNDTVRIVSVVAVIFLPPTLIASVYGMNFAGMPELRAAWGYPYALGLMLASAVGCYLFFKWRRWL